MMQTEGGCGDQIVQCCSGETSAAYKNVKQALPRSQDNVQQTTEGPPPSY